MALTDNLLAYYKLDESSGDASDSSGNSKTLTNSNVTYDTGKINNGAIFNGSNAKLVRTGNFGWTTTGSINMWVYVASTNNRSFLTTDSSGTGPNIQLFSSKIYCRVQGEGFTTDPTNFPQSQWNMLTFVWTSTTKREIFVNGSSVVTNTTSLQSCGDDVIQLGITEDSGTYFAGKFDEVGIWSKALTSTEVTTLYNSGSGLQYPFSTTSIKTINGLAVGSVATLNGLAWSSTKTLNGLS